MNKVVFIQIYSCQQKKLIKEYRHELNEGESINSIYRIVAQSKECMDVQVVTYGLTQVDLRVCPYQKDKQIVEVVRNEAVHMEHETVSVTDWDVFRGNSDQTSRDELFNILQYAINLFTFEETSHLLYDRKLPPSETKI